jgi:hypothetical protein
MTCALMYYDAKQRMSQVGLKTATVHNHKSQLKSPSQENCEEYYNNL